MLDDRCRKLLLDYAGECVSYQNSAHVLEYYVWHSIQHSRFRPATKHMGLKGFPPKPDAFILVPDISIVAHEFILCKKPDDVVSSRKFEDVT